MLSAYIVEAINIAAETKGATLKDLLVSEYSAVYLKIEVEMVTFDNKYLTWVAVLILCYLLYGTLRSVGHSINHGPYYGDRAVITVDLDPHKPVEQYSMTERLFYYLYRGEIELARQKSAIRERAVEAREHQTLKVLDEDMGESCTTQQCELERTQ